MSSARKPKVVKVLSESCKMNKSLANPESAPVETEVKPKRTRTKKPTKEEMLKMLTESSAELKQIIQELKEDETKIAGLPLKQLPILITETLKNLKEDCDEIDAECQELLSELRNEQVAC